MPCVCPSAQESGRNGHDVWRCTVCEGEKISAVCYSPPHRPTPGHGQLTGPGQGSPLIPGYPIPAEFVDEDEAGCE